MLQLKILNFLHDFVKKAFSHNKIKIGQTITKKSKIFFTFIYYHGAAVKQDYHAKYLLSGPVTSARTGISLYVAALFLVVLLVYCSY
jgi:hypothetical protein